MTTHARDDVSYDRGPREGCDGGRRLFGRWWGGSRVKVPRLAAVALALSAVVVTTALAQSTTATLKGKVYDKGGTGLPGVPVTVVSRSHGDAKRTLMTDIDGNFKFVLLPPAGDYTLNVNYPGFAPTEVGPIDLDPGKTTIQDVTLRSQ